jgi:beta-lactam-binding protein with PASTA domain
VPKLKGRTLKSARRALKKAHCALGKVHKPRHSHGRLVVRRQSPAAGKVRKNGTKVTVTLRPKH